MNVYGTKEEFYFTLIVVSVIVIAGIIVSSVLIVYGITLWNRTRTKKIIKNIYEQPIKKNGKDSHQEKGQGH